MVQVVSAREHASMSSVCKGSHFRLFMLCSHHSVYSAWWCLVMLCWYLAGGAAVEVLCGTLARSSIEYLDLTGKRVTVREQGAISSVEYLTAEGQIGLCGFLRCHRPVLLEVARTIPPFAVHLLCHTSLCFASHPLLCTPYKPSCGPSGNPLTSAGCVVLAANLPPNIRHLYLSQANILYCLSFLLASYPSDILSFPLNLLSSCHSLSVLYRKVLLGCAGCAAVMKAAMALAKCWPWHFKPYYAALYRISVLYHPPSPRAVTHAPTDLGL